MQLVKRLVKGRENVSKECSPMLKNSDRLQPGSKRQGNYAF